MMRNSDAHLPTADNQQHYMANYYLEPNPYLTATRCDSLGLPMDPAVAAASQAHLHYMQHSPKLSSTTSVAAGGHTSLPLQQHSQTRSSMNQQHHHQHHHQQQQQQHHHQSQYTHPMSPMASMSSHVSGMLGSPPMLDSSGLGMVAPPHGSSNSNPGSPYMKPPSQQQALSHLPPHSPSLSSSSSGHYDTPPPMPRYQPQVMGGGVSQHHQQLLHHHHSPSPVEHLSNSNNHYGTTTSGGGTISANESVNISTTLTHVSETGSGSDSSSHQHNYAPTPPQSQPQQQMNLSPVNNGHNGSNSSMMAVSISQGYSHSMGSNNNNSHHHNTWNHAMSQQQQQMVVVGGGKGSAKTSSANNHSPPTNHQASAFSAAQSDQFGYHLPTAAVASDYHHSITSTPVSSQPHSQQQDYLLRQKNALLHSLNHSSINSDSPTATQADDNSASASFNVSSLAASKNETPKLPPKLPQSSTAADAVSEFKNSGGDGKDGSAEAAKLNPTKKGGLITAEKRSVVVFKVVEQIIDPTTKNVLRETVLKNEEVVSSLGQVQYDLQQGHSSGGSSDSVSSSIVSHAITPSHVGSSGVLGDISGFSATGNTKSLLLNSNNNSRSNTFEMSAKEEAIEVEGTSKVASNEAPAAVEERSSSTNSNLNGSGNGNSSQSVLSNSSVENGGGGEDDDEEERRRTANALLSLHSVNNTPPKLSSATAANAEATSSPTITSVQSSPPSSSPSTVVETGGGLSSVLSAATTLSKVLTIASDTATPTPTKTTSSSRSQAATQVLAAAPSSSRRTTDRNNNDTSSATTMVSASIPSTSTLVVAPQPLPTLGPLKVGLKVMAKWKDKNFYPAELLRQLEPHKWAVKFEDAATRNLFESELIRLELLTAGQEVMLTISGDLCIRATIRKVFHSSGNGNGSSRTHHHHSPKSIEVELSYAEDGGGGDGESSAVNSTGTTTTANTTSKRPTSKRHKLRDVFLNAEQSSAILARSRPSSIGGAVFADVDLDNIVVGKRSRKVQGTTAADGSAPEPPSASATVLAAENTSSKEAKKRSSSAAPAETASVASDSDASASSATTRKRRKIAATTAETKTSPAPPLASASSSSSPSAAEADTSASASEDAEVFSTPVRSPPLSPQISNRPNLKVDISAVAKGARPFVPVPENTLAVSPRTSRSTTMVMHMPASELEKILGPVPVPVNKADNGSTGSSAKGIFEGVCFMLTIGDRHRGGSFANRRGGGSGSGNTSGGESSGSDQGTGGGLSSGAERSVPFDKLYLTRQLLAGGGTVYDTFEEMIASDEADCVLIADTYHRSVKYVQCLAAGIAIYSHLWIIDSCKADRLLDRDSYLLPSGFSIISHQIVSDKNIFKKSAILFRGVKFYFGSRLAPNLEQLWSPVLKAAQSVIVKQNDNMHKTLNRKMVDIIIGDATCEEELVMRAKNQKVPLVSSEFIVQCLINGRKLPFEACKCFRYDHTCTGSCPM